MNLSKRQEEYVKWIVIIGLIIFAILFEIYYGIPSLKERAAHDGAQIAEYLKTCGHTGQPPCELR